MAKLEKARTTTLVLIVLMSLIAAYGFGSWAIDSGSILVYVLSFASIYVTIRAVMQLFKRKFHDYSTKNRRTKKA